MIEIKKPISGGGSNQIITENYDLIALGTNFTTLNTTPQVLTLSNKSATNRIIPIAASIKGFSIGVVNYTFTIAFLSGLNTPFEIIFGFFGSGIIPNQSFNIVVPLYTSAGSATNNQKSNEDYYLNSILNEPLAAFTQFEISISYFVI